MVWHPAHVARAAVASARRQAKLNPELPIMQLEASVVLVQAAGVNERALRLAVQ